MLDYFTKVLEDDLKAVVKPQYVDQIPKAVKAADKTVETLLKARSQMDNYEKILDVLGVNHKMEWPVRLLIINAELRQVLDRDIDKLSGGELQRFAIGIVCVQQADV
jgi:ATP-binding cassette subfamily E protein 1